MRKRRLLQSICVVLLSCVLIAGMAACAPKPVAPDAEPAVDTLAAVNAENYPTVDGSTSCLPLLAALYARACDTSVESAEMNIHVSGGTGAVWRGIFGGTSDMAIVYEAPQAIRDEFSEQFDRFAIDPLALDGLVFMTYKDNPVDALTRQQLIDIYTGKITNWREVGGEDLPIIPFQRNEESGSQTLFRKLLMQDIEPMQAPHEYYVGDMAGLIDRVADFNPSAGALGFSVYYYADLMYTNPNLKMLSVDGVAPSPETIADGYPLVNAFYLVTPKDIPSDAPVAVLRDWLLSAEGAQLLIEHNYVPAAA